MLVCLVLFFNGSKMRDLEEILEVPAERLASFGRRHGVTLLAILVLNMLIVVGLMSMRLVTMVAHEEVVALDFVDEEAVRELEKRYEEYEAQLRAQPPSALRNIAVNAAEAQQQEELNSALSDDKHTDAQQIYEEMLRARAAVAETRAAAQEQSLGGEEDIPTAAPVVQETKVYKGPSVLSYELEHRTKVSLPVPAYKCRLGGVVRVSIWVNKTGAVVRAVVDAERAQGGADWECIRDAALEAASRSRFNASPGAPDLQEGRITYQFVPQ